MWPIQSVAVESLEADPSSLIPCSRSSAPKAIFTCVNAIYVDGGSVVLTIA